MFRPGGKMIGMITDQTFQDVDVESSVIIMSYIIPKLMSDESLNYVKPSLQEKIPDTPRLIPRKSGSN